MRRALIVTFALLASILVAAAPVGAVSTNTSLGSVHTTDADFNNASTLSDVRVTGGSVTLASGAVTLEGFESGDLSSWSGDTGAFSVQSGTVKKGTYAAQGGDSDGTTESMTSSIPDRQYQNVSVWMRDEVLASNGHFPSFHLRKSGLSGPNIYIDDGTYTSDAGSVFYWDGTTGQDTGIDIAASTWYEFSFENIDYSANTYDIVVRDSTGAIVGSDTGVPFDENINSADQLYLREHGDTVYFDDIHYDAPGSATSGTYIGDIHDVSNVENGFTDFSSLDNVTAFVTWQACVGGGSCTDIRQDTYTTPGNKSVDISTTTEDELRANVTFVTTGANPSAVLDAEGVTFTNVAPQANNASASPSGTSTNNESVELSIDVSDGTFPTAQGDSVSVDFVVNGSTVDTQQITSNQTVTATVGGLSKGSHTWRVELADEYGATAISETFNFEVRHYAPTFDNASASPQGGAKLTEREVTLSIPVNDRDFGDSTSEAVVVNFTVDGKDVGSDTLTSNGTATLTTSVSVGGSHTWQARANSTRGGGEPTYSDTFTFQVPSELRIYNESDPDQLVTNANATLEFYVKNGTQTDVYTRNASGGSVNMTGLPADQPMVVVVKADGYVNRRIFVMSLYETQRVYMIPESATIVEPTFVLIDYSGDFDPSVSVLEIERYLNGSWQTVEGDYFGATGKFSAHLAFNERYMLQLTNTRTGETRRLGPYTPTTSTEREIKVFSNGSVTVEGQGAAAVFDPSLGTLDASSNVPVKATFIPADTDFVSYEFTADYEFPNGTEVQLSTVSGTNSDGEQLSTTLDLSGLEGGRVNLEASWVLSDGATGSDSESLIVERVAENSYSVLPVVGQLTGRLPGTTRGAFTAFVAIMLTALITGLAATQKSLGVEAVGLVAIFAIGFFVLIQWLDQNVLYMSAMAWLGIVALRRGL